MLDSYIHRQSMMRRSFSAIVIAIGLAAAISCASTTPVQAPVAGTDAKAPDRETARSALDAMSKGLTVSDETCAANTLERKDIELAKKCKEAYDVTRSALDVAKGAVDSWDKEKRDAACPASNAATGLEQFRDAFTKAKISIPEALVDALSRSEPFGRVCRGST